VQRSVGSKERGDQIVPPREGGVLALRKRGGRKVGGRTDGPEIQKTGIFDVKPKVSQRIKEGGKVSVEPPDTARPPTAKSASRPAAAVNKIYAGEPVRPSPGSGEE